MKERQGCRKSWERHVYAAHYRKEKEEEEQEEKKGGDAEDADDTGNTIQLLGVYCWRKPA